MKICKLCQTKKPLTEFYAHKTNADGLNGKCKSCCITYTSSRYLPHRKYATRNREKRLLSRKRYRSSEKGKAYDRKYSKSEVAKKGRARYQRKRYTEFRNKIAKYKLDVGCQDCGYNNRPEALDFDHLPGSNKDFVISKIVGKSWTKIEQEIAKCEVVCANCHRVRTVTRKQHADTQSTAR